MKDKILEILYEHMYEKTNTIDEIEFEDIAEEINKLEQ